MGNACAVSDRKKICLNEGNVNKAVLFLDVDGVLNTSRCFRYYAAKTEPKDGSLLFVDNLFKSVERFTAPLEKVLLANLKLIVDVVPNLSIVISSTWREDVSLRRFLVAALKKSRIDVDRIIIGDTPILSDKCRGCEVRQWLDMHPEYSNYVIVDDNFKASFQKYHLAHRFVMTYLGPFHSEEGLTEHAAEKVVALFVEGVNG